jgi:hypothetical protein
MTGVAKTIWGQKAVTSLGSVALSSALETDDALQRMARKSDDKSDVFTIASEVSGIDTKMCWKRQSASRPNDKRLEHTSGNRVKDDRNPSTSVNKNQEKVVVRHTVVDSLVLCFLPPIPRTLVLLFPLLALRRCLPLRQLYLQPHSSSFSLSSLNSVRVFGKLAMLKQLTLLLSLHTHKSYNHGYVSLFNACWA